MGSFTSIQKTISELHEFNQRIHSAIQILESLSAHHQPTSISQAERAAVVECQPIPPETHLPPLTGDLQKDSEINTCCKPVPSKVCRMCGEKKPLAGGFQLHKECKDGYMATCRACRKSKNAKKDVEATIAPPAGRPITIVPKDTATTFYCRKGCGKQFHTMYVRDDHEKLRHPEGA